MTTLFVSIPLICIISFVTADSVSKYITTASLCVSKNCLTTPSTKNVFPVAASPAKTVILLLATPPYIDPDSTAFNTYDPVYFSKQPEHSTPIPVSKDIAIVKNREDIGKIYLLKDSTNNLEKIILPIRGYGLWGTLFGYIAIDKDLNTIRGLEFYSHKETPGLGAEVDNPKWKALWDGKTIYKNNAVEIEVIKGKVDSSNQMASYQVDGLSGATLTSRGVTNMLVYWFGESGYKETLKNINYDS